MLAFGVGYGRMLAIQYPMRAEHGAVSADVVFREHVVIESLQLGSGKMLYAVADGADELIAPLLAVRLAEVGKHLCHCPIPTLSSRAVWRICRSRRG